MEAKQRPISLSDEQLQRIMSAVEILHPSDRSQFLVALADRLRAEPEVGDGSLGRALRDLLRPGFSGFFDPPKVHKGPTMNGPRMERQRVIEPIE